MAIKELIMQSALDLFALYGIKNVSMEDIARNMKISKRTIYELFRDKEELLLASMELHYRKARIYLTQLESDSFTSMDIILLFFEEVMKKPRWFCQKFYDDLKKYPKVLDTLENEKRIFYKQGIRLLAKGIREGVFHPDIDVDIIALLAKEQILRIPPAGSFKKHSVSKTYNILIYTFLRGMATEKGRRQLEKHIIKRFHNQKKINHSII